MRHARDDGPTHCIRERPEDFLVEELPLYSPQGSGAHLWIEIEKRARTTDEAVAELARAFGLERGAVGYAGRKDRHAVTRQWLSLPKVGGLAASDFAGSVLPGLRVLQAHEHAQKLRLGELRGNRFHVVVRPLGRGPGLPDRQSDPPGLEDRLEALRRFGLLNRFGMQRFGRRNDNVEAGAAVLRGERSGGDRRLARLLVSALQSELFHRVLDRRVERVADADAENLGDDEKVRWVTRLIEGDVLHEHGTGFLHRLELGGEESGSEEAQAVAALRLSPTGPLFGPAMWRPRGASAQIEDEVLAESGLDLDAPVARQALERLRLRGARRPLRVPVARLATGVEPARFDAGGGDARPRPGRWFSFELPPASYATVLIDQLYGRGTVADRGVGEGSQADPQAE